VKRKAKKKRLRLQPFSFAVFPFTIFITVLGFGSDREYRANAGIRKEGSTTASFLYICGGRVGD